MIEVFELKSKKIAKHKKTQNLISSKFPFDGNMDKINWVKTRKLLDSAYKILKPPAGFHLRTYKKGKMRFEFITPKKKTNEDIIIYIHGGGFVIGSAAAIRNYTYALADITGSCVCSIDYPRAPEYTITDMHDVLSSIYDLLTIKYPESNFIIGGCSAGGCLTLGMVEKIIREKKKIPKCIFLNSALLDMTGSYKPVNEIDDVVVKLDCKKPMSKMVLGKYKKKDYLASPLLYVNKYIPKCFICVDNSESLFTESYVMYNKCIENEVPCKLVITKNGYHAFQGLGAKTPETKELLNMLNSFIKD